MNIFATATLYFATFVRLVLVDGKLKLNGLEFI